MVTDFGKDYSNAYDLLYKEKDYEGECNLIESIITEHSIIPVHSILDLGCGTGNHSIRLAERGYEVTGVDRSQEMLDIAVQKSHKIGLKCNFIHSDICAFSENKKYDAIIMMFAVLGYQQENEDIIAALTTVSRHLKKGGVFICDIWYGPAVLSQKPGERVRVIEGDDMKIIRVSSGVIDTYRHIVYVHFHLWRIDGNVLHSETKEEHSMRFFFPQELRLLFGISGISLKEIRSFPKWDSQLDDETWNIGVVGVKKN